MKAFVLKKPGVVGWHDAPEPSLVPYGAILAPVAMTPCSSDVHTVYGGGSPKAPNLILGHECVARILEVGDQVRDFSPGEIVAVPAITPDWNSLEAQGGYAMHSGGMLAGWKFSNFKDGVFAEVFHVNDADGNLAHLPKGMDLAAAVMLSDMVPTGLHGAELADVQYGDAVLVVGIGPVGLMSVAGAALRGAGAIYAVGSRPLCQEAAKGYGATEIIDYRDGSLAEQVLALTKGRGVDKAIVAGGDVDTFADVLKVLKPGGRIGNVNYLGSGEAVRLPRLEWGCGMGHKLLTGGLMPGGRLRMEKLAALLTHGRLDVQPLLTHRFTGFDKLEEALLLMKDKPRDLIKPVVMM